VGVLGSACVGEEPQPNRTKTAATTASDAGKAGSSSADEAAHKPAEPTPKPAVAADTAAQGGAGSASKESGGAAGASKESGGSSGASKPAASMASGASGGGAAATEPSTCFINFKGNACGQCLAHDCDAACIDCGGDAGCRKVWECLPGCGNDTQCVDSCAQGLSERSQQRIGNLSKCFDQCASACGLVQIGDHCTDNKQCSNSMCLASSCTTYCSSDAECGANTAGNANLCLLSSANVSTCFPGCRSQADCQAFPGRQCLTDGTRSVCATPPAGMMSSGSGACQDCLAAQCRSQLTACSNDQGCLQYLNCQCTDSQCSNCTAAVPAASQQIILALATCVQQRCPSC
jgi:hypothetical protein